MLDEEFENTRLDRWYKKKICLVPQSLFEKNIRKGKIKEFISFLVTNLINLIVPLFIWYLIDKFNPSIQENEIQFLAATIIIHGAILPLKYLIYKFFVFKDSLNS